MLYCMFFALLIQESLSQTLDYVCNKRGEVKILKTGIEEYQWIYASGVRNAQASQPCNVTEANDTTVGYGIKFVISNCDLDTAIQVTLTTSKEDRSIIGGKGAIGFDIKCNGVLEGGENISLVQTILSKDKTFIERYHEKADHQMIIRARNGTRLPDGATVSIGEELSVLISTSNNFSFSVISCYAQSDIAKDTKLLIQNGNAEDSSLMTLFSNTNDSKRNYAEAKLYAFHFVNKEHLTLTCVIFVCRISDTTCKHRQTRNAPTEDDNFTSLTESLKATFVVVDGEKSRSIGTSGAKPISYLHFERGADTFSSTPNRLLQENYKLPEIKCFVDCPSLANLVVVAVALLKSYGRRR